ncbi:hypothetical protein B7R54_04830 [Subtercola boreus]|uniref:Maltokinase N-terminal cap domain-containing protein n=1 Tax=Subtercola boreus TaxID=120213 RepID=A0A3E0VG41_9MICO|nr:hypothetical protein [Subtercola boreus]RFA08629.1 hypothetical protein B7R54_04830 [Subtercola boreus]TQL54431.1 hypothetical protein FB464_1970 [Subtercola boreus]
MALLHKAVLTPSKLELLQEWVPAQPWFTAADTDGAGGPDVPDGALEQVGSYRFDDPAGEVGIETMLLRVPAGSGVEGPVLQVPVTYRAEPLDGAGDWLVGTVEHSVLGTRWVYDACGDPVYAAVLGTVILGGGSHVEQHWVIDGEMVPKPLDTLVEGTGGSAVLGGEVASGGAGGADGAGGAGGAPGVAAISSVETGPESTLIRAGGIVLEVLRRVTGDGTLTPEEAASAARADTSAAVAGMSALLLGRWPGEPEPRLLASASRG